MEGPPKQESIEKARVLEMLRTRGLEDPETQELVMRWTEEQERRVESEPGNKDLPILFNTERADLYIAVGDVEGALECLEDALLQAQQEGKEEIYGQILKKIEEVENMPKVDPEINRA